MAGGRIGMAIGVVRFREPPQAFGLSPAQDYLMWALAGDRREFGVPDEQLTALEPAGLHALSAELIRTWIPTCGRCTPWPTSTRRSSSGSAPRRPRRPGRLAGLPCWVTPSTR